MPLLVGLQLIPAAARGAVIAADNASDPAYAVEPDGAWKGLNPTTDENSAGMDNGGSGFLPWDFVGGYHDETLSPYGRLNHFIDGVDFPASAFNNLGAPAFGLSNANKANFGFTARATRVFSQPLAVGGTISVQFDNPVLAPLKQNDDTGFIIRLNSGGGAKVASNPDVKERFGFFAMHGFHSGNWNRTDAAGVSNTGLSSSATTSGATFRLTLETAESYRFELLPLTGEGVLYSATGYLANAGASSIDTLEIVMFGNGSGNGATGDAALATGAREFFFNNLALDNPPQTIVSDYNGDGKVDAADYVVWRKIGGTPDEYNTWRANFGMMADNGAGLNSSSNAVVPEPSALVLVLTGMLAIYFRRRISTPSNSSA